MTQVSKYDCDTAMVISDRNNDKDNILELNPEELNSINNVLTAYLCNMPDSCTSEDMLVLERLKIKYDLKPETLEFECIQCLWMGHSKDMNRIESDNCRTVKSCPECSNKDFFIFETKKQGLNNG